MLRWLGPVLLAAAALGAGCGDDDGASVGVTLGEFVVQLDPATASSGEVTLDVENAGGETHEVVVVRAASAEALPTDDDGAVDEDAVDPSDAIDEIEDIEAGDDASLTADLSAATYVVFCNIVEEEDGEVESHVVEGMHAVLVVSD